MGAVGEFRPRPFAVQRPLAIRLAGCYGLHVQRIIRLGLAFVLLALVGVAAPAAGADKLVWRAGGERVDADIDGWSLPQLLEHLAEATGWQVFVQPGAQLKQPVSVKFSNLAAGDALGRMLGELNFAVLPQPGASPKLFVFRTAIADATQRVPPREPVRAKAIADELILLRKPGSKTDAEELAKRLGAKVIGRVGEFGAYRLKFADAEAARAARETLTDNADFNVDSNYAIPRPVVTDPLAASSMAALTIKPDASAPAGQLVVGLIDAAVQKSTPSSAFLLPGVSVAGEAVAGTAAPTHGTSMFETLLRGLASTQDAGAASAVRVLPVDVYGDAASTSTYDVARGIVEALNAGASVVNLSLASAGDSALLHSVIKQGAERGVLFIAAAGNEPTTAPNYPAAYPEVLAVTAGARNGQLASYANRGEFVDVVAPGSSIIQFGGKTYLVSGTSASTAYVSGMAAGMKSSTGANAAAISAKLIEVLGLKK